MRRDRAREGEEKNDRYELRGSIKSSDRNGFLAHYTNTEITHAEIRYERIVVQCVCVYVSVCVYLYASTGIKILMCNIRLHGSFD